MIAQADTFYHYEKGHSTRQNTLLRNGVQLAASQASSLANLRISKTKYVVDGWDFVYYSLRYVVGYACASIRAFVGYSGDRL